MENKVFDKFWFEKHSHKLVWLANSCVGKYIFKFQKMGHYIENKIVKITPNSVAELISFKGDQIELKEHFFSRNEYARKLYFYLYPLWLFMHIWDWFVADHFTLAPQLSFGFSTLTQYPGSLGSNNPDDGCVARIATQNTWSSIRNSAGTYVDSSAGGEAGSAYLFIFSSGATTDNWTFIGRYISSFDTSGLTSSVIISGAILSFYGVVSTNTFSSVSPAVNIYSATPGNTALLATSDYGQIGTTHYSTAIAYSSLSLNNYNDFVLNATGYGSISKTGITSFGVREETYDVANSAPTWNASKTCRFEIAVAGSSFYGKPPTLVVTYTLPAPSGGAFLFNMI